MSKLHIPLLVLTRIVQGADFDVDTQERLLAGNASWTVAHVRTCVGTETEYGACPNLPVCSDTCVPQDCKFNDWSDWTQPVNGCTGLCTRQRDFAQQNNDCGAPCRGNSKETKQCAQAPNCIRLTKDCVLNDWDKWTPCGGSALDQKMRARKKPSIKQNASNGGKPCAGELTQTQPCGSPTPPVDCAVSSWGAWSPCTKPCARGLMNRSRTIVTPNKLGGAPCNKSLGEESVCNIQECSGKTSCSIGDWSDWSSTCSAWNQLKRTRILHPASKGGSPCASASLEEFKVCDFTPLKDCVFHSWQEWKACSRTCDGGQMRRERTYTPPQYGGNCSGRLEETAACGTGRCMSANESDCKVKDWMDWSTCSAQCGEGIKTRNRQGLVKMKNGGNPCKDTLSEVAKCQIKPCTQVDCKWADWKPWEPCTASCGGGFRQRARDIASQPQNAGAACPSANTTEVDPCNTLSCDAGCRDGEWADWQPWGHCSVSCGSGYKARTRSAAKSPNYCGYPASGVNGPNLKQEFTACNGGHANCTVDKDCKVGDWSDWGGCSATCYGVKEKYRDIIQYAAGNGKQCVLTALSISIPCNPGTGEKADSACGTKVPAIDCKLSDWKDWGQCSAQCGGGQKNRYRTIVTPPQNNGKACPLRIAVTTACNMGICSDETCDDCKLSAWEPWGACSLQGQSTRSRDVQQNPNYCGLPCNASAMTMTRPCNASTAVVSYCAWADWSPFTACPTDSCPDTKRRRTRSLSFQSQAADYLFKVVGASTQCFGTQVETNDCPDTKNCPTACNPKNCILSDWSDWNIATVGAGLCGRSRRIDVLNNECGKSCGYVSMSETKACPVHHAAVDCTMSDWSLWSRCYNSEGLQFRMRQIIQQPVHGGLACLGALKETNHCYWTHPPSNCTYSQWADWSKTCDVSGSLDQCGGGFVRRHRAVNQAATFGGVPCAGNMTEYKKCNGPNCVQPGAKACEFTAWDPWRKCTPSYQHVRTRRFRSAIKGGQPCNGPLEEIAGCAPRPVDCEYSTWQPWSSCNKTCAGGRSERSRNISVFQSYGGKACTANDTFETRPCNSGTMCPDQQDCKVDDWADWSTCSVSCGYQGQQLRIRNFVPRKVAGNGCTDELQEARPCKDLKICVHKDCAWKDWSSWSTCTKTCGRGHRTRNRNLAQAPQGYGAKTCVAKNMTETEPCGVNACPKPQCRNGTWSDWGPWEVCSASCGSGVTWRSRRIATQANYCGKPVTGKSQEVATCTSQAQCPVSTNCQMGDWSKWTACSSTCDGVKRRSRAIKSYAVGTGTACTASKQEVAPCANSFNATGCPVPGNPIDCELTTWSAWTPCAVTCGAGQINRNRTVKVNAQYGGKACDDPSLGNGALVQTKDCGKKPCNQAQSHQVLDCQWAAWSSWGNCNQCGGVMYRSRSVQRPATYGGKPCNGTDAEEIGKCDKGCGDQVSCAWTDWGSWAPCTLSCKPKNSQGQAGRRIRTRHLKATVVKGSQLYEDGSEDLDVQVQELYRRAKQADARRVQEVCAAFVMGCLSLMVALGVAMRCGSRRTAFSRGVLRPPSCSSKSNSVHLVDRDDRDAMHYASPRMDDVVDGLE